MIKEVTYYKAACDCCGEEADYGDRSAWSTSSDAITYADPDLIEVGEEILCTSCWCWPDDLPDYPGDDKWAGSDDPVRKHAEHPSSLSETTPSKETS